MILFFFSPFLLSPLLCLGETGLTQAQKQFAHQLAIQDNFDEQQVLTWLKKSKPEQVILTDTKHPKEDSRWDLYEKLFITQRNIEDGVAFYKKNEKTLTKSYQQQGVDRAIVVAIIGIESHFGEHQGNHDAVTALNTLAFYGNRRQELFKEELRDLFLLSRKLNLDPLTIKSSYSGALGQPQFMPTTYLHYAISPTGKQSNLFTHTDDTIFSIANYLAKMGWKKGEPVAIKTTKRSDLTFDFLEDGKNELWDKSVNFPAIHHYNQSNKYVLAVSELADKIRQKL